MAATTRPRMSRIEGSRAVERIAGQTTDPPVVQHLRPEAAIEADRRLVPIEHSPFHAAASALDRNRGQMRHEALTHAALSPLGDDEQILQVETGLAEERREVVKEQR